MLWRIVFFFLACLPIAAKAQYNVDKLLMNGKVALHYEDYVLSMQYFNQVIALKPYLYEPWQYRAIAKFYLEDYTGSEKDISKAIELNPYIPQFFDLRAISFIKQERFDDAVADYTRAIKLSPSQQGYWFNRAICLVNQEKYQEAMLQTDTIIKKWSTASKAYSLRAEILLHQKDTLNAGKALDKSLELDAYDANTWITKAYISLARKQWKDADKELSKAIHLRPDVSNYYINRALARLNYNNLRGAMTDYDIALDLNPNDFLGHYNRGLLRMQLGDDNRAIEDFDYVVKMEPQNLMAIFNRALLLERTGDFRGAIRDYSVVIDRFPNFWTGLSYRAKCYRILGMKGKAEMDEYRILKAQMDKRLGVQQRWSKAKLKEMRKRSEIDPEKYNQIVVADENVVEHEYASAYRGQVQNKKVDGQLLPMYELSFLSYDNGIQAYQAFSKAVESFNAQHRPKQVLHVTCNPKQLNEQQSKHYFEVIDSLTDAIHTQTTIKAVAPLLLQRAIAYAVVQNFDAAIVDLETYLAEDSNNILACWQLAVCEFMVNNYKTSQGMSIQLKTAKMSDDFTNAIKLDNQNAYLFYNRGNFYAAHQDIQLAINDYTQAIALDNRLAEAYYNRGLLYFELGNKAQGIADLSKAGELGLYNAYSVMKKHQSK